MNYRKKQLFIIMLTIIVTFAFTYINDLSVYSAGEVHPTCSYINNGFFDWADLAVEVGSDGKLKQITAKAWYCYSTATACNGRTYGYFFVDSSADPLNGEPKIEIPIATAQSDYFSKGKKITESGTISLTSGNRWLNCKINAEYLADCNINSEYRIYIWTNTGQKVTFESCMGTLTKVSINQYVNSSTNVSSYSKVSETLTMGIIGAPLNCSSVKYHDITYNATKTGTIGNITQNASYNLYYDGTHDWSYSSSGNQIIATCKGTGNGCLYTDCNHDSNDTSVKASITLDSTACTFNDGSKGWIQGDTDQISFTIDNKDTWESIVGELDVSTIYYEGTGSTTYTKSTTKPVSGGSYKAIISKAGKDAFVDFNIGYRITFNNNGGTGAISSVYISPASSQYALPINTMRAPMNKEFDGWSTSPNGSKITSSNIYISSNTTLYAVWINHNHRLTTKNIGNQIVKVSCDCGFYIIRFE